MSPLRTLAALLFAALAGCSTTRSIAITTVPTGAMVQVDGQNLGSSPTAAELQMSKGRRVVLTAIEAGYHTEELVISDQHAAVSAGHVQLVLMEDEAWKATTTSEATNSWLRVQVDETIEERDVWQKLIDSVTTHYSNLEQLDDASGYVRTVTQLRRFRGPGGAYQVRTRFLCSMSSRTPLVYKFKVESEITDGRGDWVPYGRVFKTDAQLVAELQDRLGMK